ncbi:DUF6460 domain-containing protein [Aureimonas mangrovi]|uniref:DUF6460 domain-containing protein n=1 Tax=Aureimonas mangrovi TaxID=2758041 RepID=UPI00163DC8A4|nr:DUF6460 domain-containing protein [Aureimonas mangrovi]
MSGPVTRFLGGSPLSVLLKLALLSLAVGILLSWLNLQPLDLVEWIVDLVRDAWSMVFGSLGRAAEYFVLGAVIVVPIFLISRLMKSGRG